MQTGISESLPIYQKVHIHMINALLSFLACVAVGALVGGTGVYMVVSGDATPLHSYHRSNVQPQDLAVLARWSGLGAVMLGVGIILLSLPLLAKTRPLPGWARGMLPVVLGGAFLIIGAVVITGSIVYYNGAIVAS